MTNEYLVALNDGVKFKTTDLDLKVIQASLESRNTVAVRLGKKGVQKNIIVIIANEDAIIPEEGKNLCVTVANTNFYFAVDDIDSTIDNIINDVNTNQWVNVLGGLVFNRNAFQFLEEHITQA